ncbi:MAG: amidohydrolase family protein [Planctomycetaceae bacterium]
MIWDLHCHISGVEGKTVDEKMAQMIAYADRMQIERLVVYMGLSFSLDPDPQDFRRQNDEVLQALSHWHHRAFGFAYVNPKYPDESLAEIERCIVNGPMIGIKLWVAVRCNDKRLDAIVSRCGELKALVFQHTWLKTMGNFEGESTPMDMAELAAKHPDMPLICGHTGGDWEQGIRAIRPYKNVSVDLAGSEPTAGFVEMAVRELGAERVIYGSDIGGRSFSTQLAKVKGAQISNVEKSLILGKNLRRMMEPILHIKGVRP